MDYFKRLSSRLFTLIAVVAALTLTTTTANAADLRLADGTQFSGTQIVNPSLVFAAPAAAAYAGPYLSPIPWALPQVVNPYAMLPVGFGSPLPLNAGAVLQQLYGAQFQAQLQALQAARQIPPPQIQLAAPIQAAPRTGAAQIQAAQIAREHIFAASQQLQEQQQRATVAMEQLRELSQSPPPAEGARVRASLLALEPLPQAAKPPKSEAPKKRKRIRIAIDIEEEGAPAGAPAGAAQVEKKEKPKRDEDPEHAAGLLVCPEPGCGETFSKPFVLKRHAKKHSGERPFKCLNPGCDKAFAEKSTLTRHARTHTGERPFKCSYPGCDKTFADKTNVRRHENIHTGKKFSCPVGCGKSYSRKSVLTKHIKDKHGGAQTPVGKAGDAPADAQAPADEAAAGAAAAEAN